MPLLLLAAFLLLGLSRAAQGGPPPSPFDSPVSSLPNPSTAVASVMPVANGPADRQIFSLQTELDSSNQVVRMVELEPGHSEIGPGTASNWPIASQEIPTPGAAIQNEAIVIDAAPDAEARNNLKLGKKKEVRPATEYESFAWIAGTGNQLGMLEWIGRDLAVYDYAFAETGRFHVAPGFAMRWLNGPDTTDLPPYLFSIFADVGMGFHLANNWVLDTEISPSWNTDFANKGYKLFRLPWQAVNSFQVTEEWKIVVGVTDLAREDIRLLPVAGFSYAPIDGSKQFDLIFPRPKIAWRLSHRDEDSYWGYFSGELGGGSFSIERADRQPDIVTLRDYRLLVGIERRGQMRHASRIEAGWIFGRAVEYQSNVGNYHPGDTAIIRIATDY